MKPKAVIFDRDGVLTYFDVPRAQAFFQPLLPFSIFELAQRWQQWGEQVGFPTNHAEERAFFAGFWESLRQSCGLTDAQYHALNACQYTDFLQPFPDVISVLQALKARGVAVGVLSNFSLASLDTSLAAIGVAAWVDVACAATVIGFAKPAPEAYRYVAAQLHVAPEDCLFLDDEMPCVDGARAVGMTAYLVDRSLKHDAVEQKILHNLTGVLNVAF